MCSYPKPCVAILDLCAAILDPCAAILDPCAAILDLRAAILDPYAALTVPCVAIEVPVLLSGVLVGIPRKVLLRASGSPERTFRVLAWQTWVLCV